jgi:N-methylhydantoinase A
MNRPTIGIDTGGTFTDLYLVDGEQTRVAKLASTPDDPARAVIDGLELVGGAGPGDHIVHGTTVALNALLTASTARVAFVTGEGFRDLIEIGRQERSSIYDLHPTRAPALVPRDLRFEISGRIWPTPHGEDAPGDQDGTEENFVTVQEPTAADLERLVEEVRAGGAESLVIGLLHSWADPSLEERIGEALAALELPITLSAHILPEHREFERFSTAIVNASLVPLMRDYLASLDERIHGARLSILQSSGGTLSAAVAAREPVRVILSGPAGGVVGAAYAARDAGLEAFVALDMGGTSTDVAFHHAGQFGARRQAERRVDPVPIAEHPVAIPSLDIHTIGCGGGSLVSIDAGGILHVGPESAGADPGPVCYGKSDRATVTDAHVFLGHIAEGPFLAGGLPLRTDAVERAFEELGRRLEVSPVRAASGVLEVARAAMRRAIGVMTMQRGQDPERLPLIAFGGAGGLHAAALAERLGMPAALVPAHPGALSARGMSGAEAMRDSVHTILAPLTKWRRKRRRTILRELSDECREELIEAGHSHRSVLFEHALDLRYHGQSFEIQVPESSRPDEAFHTAHERLYGYRLEDREIELVCLRSRALVPSTPFTHQRARSVPFDPTAVIGERIAVFGRRRRSRVIERERLRPGQSFEGPALVEEYSGTTLVPPDWRATVTAGCHLLLESRKGLLLESREGKRDAN